MATFHLRAKIIQRSNGQSAVKSASYRHAQRLYDERLGKAFSYTQKADVVHSAILAPEGAPAWVFDRSQLWNRVEMSETRINSQVAREIEISIPRELSPDQRVALVHAFIRSEYVARGMVADIAIHTPIGGDGIEQPHAHVMLTMRRLDGTTKLATTFIIGRVGQGDYGIALAYSTALILLMGAITALIQALVGERKLGRRARLPAAAH